MRVPMIGSVSTVLLIILWVLIAMALSGCMVTDREALYYTRADVDAITTQIACKAQARNLVQIARCEVRR